MPLTGTLRSWNDERGYGFIAPTGGGRELFVHISAFPRDGSRPTVGESLNFELGRGKDGKPAAVRVYRRALGNPESYPRSRPRVAGRQRSPRAAIVSLLLLFGVGAFGYSTYQNYLRQPASTLAAPVSSDAPDETATPVSSFRCDGRTHCSQMTSCREATFFLKNCPGTKMDGNNDGVPCEQQWCTGPFAK
jgi:cold shock CspA family protein